MLKKVAKNILILFSISIYAQDPPPLGLVTTSYNYDNLNRLVQVVFNDGRTKNYTYDDLGNRIQLNIQTLTIDAETLKNPMVFYPNPTNAVLNIELPEVFLETEATIQLFDINGRLIQNTKPKIKDSTIIIDVKTLPNGVYLINLSNKNQKFSKLFIKK